MENILNISKTDLEYIKGRTVKVYEKLDMTRFSVDVMNDGVTVFSAKNKRLRPVDAIINSINDDILAFVDSNVTARKDELISTFGECRIWFFYLPVKKTKTIEYSTLDEGTFILSELYTADKNNNDISKMKDFLGNGVVLYTPISTIDSVDDSLYGSISSAISDNDTTSLQKILTDGKTFTGIDSDKISGLIVRVGNKSYKLIVNDTTTDIDATTKSMYRDAILCDFENVMLSEEMINFTVNIASDILDSPETKVCKLFLEYLNRTDIFARLFLEDDDLLPPISGYIGDIKWDAIPSTTRLVCKNENYKNILRILLVSLLSDSPESKFKTLPDDVSHNLLYLIDKL